ncbi:MAG: hypothetical protein IJP14_06170, partial [Clostridia bacterium]|nr:hypothetical protein [Clostridia bacterium]
MKKYAAIVLAVLLAVSMLCTGVSAEEAGSNEPTTTTAAPSVLSVTLKLDISDEGQVTVTATDSNGAPANGYALSLIVNNMAYNAKTENGKHVSPFTVDAGNSASVEGLRTECENGVIYDAASMISKDR